MNLVFNGFRHYHIFTCYKQAAVHKDIKILGAVEADEIARNHAEKTLGISVATTGMEDWLNNPEVDTVVIGGAFGTRGKACIEALEHGKHIFCDKPICTDLAELAEIRRLSREKNLMVGCLLDLRDIASVTAAKELFESGEMGEIKNISFTGQHYIDYTNRPGWYFEEGMHGGTLNDIAIHGIDMLPFLTGHSINKVYCARTWNGFAYKNPEFEDCAHFMAETDKGAGVVADVSYSGPSQVFSMPTYWNFKIWCTKGLVTFCCKDPDVTVYRDGAQGAEIIPGKTCPETVFQTFVREALAGERTTTEAILAASEMALLIQNYADTHK